MKKENGAFFTVSIDGGINDKTAKWCWANGADQLCGGSYLFQAEDIKKAWDSLQKVG